jgi:hypothetical protein
MIKDEQTYLVSLISANLEPHHGQNLYSVLLSCSLQFWQININSSAQ